MMTESLHIEDDVKLKDATFVNTRRGPYMAWPFPSMEVGDSFRVTIPELWGKCRSNAQNYGSKHGGRFECHKVVESGSIVLRCWRTK